MKETEDRVQDQIRLNVAFEQSVLSVLTGAAIGGALSLVVDLFVVLGTGLSFMQLVSTLVAALTASFLIFLAGFISSILVVAPLFLTLERAKKRILWPYPLAALLIAFLIMTVLHGQFPLVSDFDIEAVMTVILPALIIGVLFARRMRPYLIAAARAESTTVAPRSNVTRLH